MFLHHAFDIFDDDDGVIDDDADRKYDGEKGYRVCRIADRQQRNEGADETDRHGKRRNQRRTQASQKEKDNDHDENESLDQCLLHFVDGVGDKDRGIVGGLPSHIFGKSLLRFGNPLFHRL